MSLEVVGIGAVATGIWWIYPPAAIIVAGLLLAILAQGISR